MWFASSQPHLQTPVSVIESEARDLRNPAPVDVENTPNVKKRPCPKTGNNRPHKIEFSSSEDEISEMLRAHNKKVQSQSSKFSVSKIGGCQSKIAKTKPISSEVFSKFNNNSRRSAILSKKVPTNCWNNISKANQLVNSNSGNICSDDLKKKQEDMSYNAISKNVDLQLYNPPVKHMYPQKSKVKTGCHVNDVMTNSKRNSPDSVVKSNEEKNSHSNVTKIVSSDTSNPCSSIYENAASATSTLKSEKQTGLPIHKIRRSCVIKSSTQQGTRRTLCQSKFSTTKITSGAAAACKKEPLTQNSGIRNIPAKNYARPSGTTKISGGAAAVCKKEPLTQKSVIRNIPAKNYTGQSGTSNSSTKCSSDINGGKKQPNSSNIPLTKDKSKNGPRRTLSQIQNKSHGNFSASSNVMSIINTKTPGKCESGKVKPRYSVETPSPNRRELVSDEDDLDSFIMDQLKAHNAKVQAKVRTNNTIQGKSVKTEKRLGSPPPPKVKPTKK